jgi:hypothetical protein
MVRDRQAAHAHGGGHVASNAHINGIDVKRE